MRSSKFFIASLAMAAMPLVLPAQQMGIPAATVPMIVQGVGIDQNLNAQIPLELHFKDETGCRFLVGIRFVAEVRYRAADDERYLLPVRRIVKRDPTPHCQSRICPRSFSFDIGLANERNYAFAS